MINKELKQTISPSTLKKIRMLLEDNTNPETIANMLSEDIDVVRHFDNELILKSINSYDEQKNIVSEMKYVMHSAGQNSRLTKYTSRILASVLFVLGCSPAQVHVTTKLSVHMVHDIQNNVRRMLESHIMPTCLSIPDTICTRIITSIFMSHYRRVNKFIHSFDYIDSLGIDDFDIGNIDFTEDRKKLLCILIAQQQTVAEVDALQLSNIMASLQSNATDKKTSIEYEFNEEYLSFGAFYMLASIQDRQWLVDRNSSTPARKFMTEGYCPKQNCKSHYAYRSNPDRNVEHECPFCELSAAVQGIFPTSL